MQPLKVVFGIDICASIDAPHGSTLRCSECFCGRHLIDIQQPGVLHQIWNLLLQLAERHIVRQHVEHALWRECGELVEEIVLYPLQLVFIRCGFLCSSWRLELKCENLRILIQFRETINAFLIFFMLRETSKVGLWHLPSRSHEVEYLGADVQF